MDIEKFLQMLKSGKIVIYVQQMTVQIQPEKKLPSDEDDCDPRKCNEVVCGLFGQCKHTARQSDDFSSD